MTGLDIELTSQLLRQDTEPVLLDDEVIAAQQAEADAFYDAGVIPTEVDFASIVDDRLDLDVVAIDGSIHKAPCGGEGTGKPC